MLEHIRNMKLRARLLLSYAVIIVICLAASIAALFMLNKIGNNLSSFYNNNYTATVNVLISKGEVKCENYSFQIAASADEVTPKLVQGDLDIAAVPANLSSILYNNTKGKVQVLAVNTLGVLYIVENGETVQSAADLKGKTIYASGKGSTPELSLIHI